MFFAKPQQRHDCLLARVKELIKQQELWITELLLHAGLLHSLAESKVRGDSNSGSAVCAPTARDGNMENSIKDEDLCGKLTPTSPTDFKMSCVYFSDNPLNQKPAFLTMSSVQWDTFDQS